MRIISLQLCLPILLLMLLLAHSMSATHQDQHHVDLERHYDFQGGAGCSGLQWTVDRDSLELTVSWKSPVGAEWTAWGVSEFGSMKGADIALVRQVVGDGDEPSFEVEDRFSLDFGLPELDKLQHVELLQASYDEEGRMEVTIKRDIKTCDAQDIEIRPHKQYIVCASGQLSSDGKPLYHGEHRSSGLVNLMVDEELLFERKLEVLPNASKLYLGEGITVRGDLNASVTPFPIDIQMPNITLEGDKVTHYQCKTFQFSSTMAYAAFEGVWGDGVTERTGKRNDILHHTMLYYCDSPSDLVQVHMDGKPWDCHSEMPSCEPAAVYAKGSGIIEAPAGLHFNLNKGTYVLLVHYENLRMQPVHGDQSGFRLWMQPPALNEISTTESRVVVNDGLYASLRIPADPEQKPVTKQYLISGEATSRLLPPGGVQVFGSQLHMHKLGMHGKVALIRDGVHIQNVYESKSYDFDRQTPAFNQWRMLPGDALVVSCTWKPLIDRDVVAGFSTDDEMCSYHFALAPAVSGWGRAMGVFVDEGEPFLNTRVGSNDTNLNVRLLNYSSYNIPPSPSSWEDVKPFKDHRENICKSFVRKDLLINTISFADPAIYAHVVILGAFLVVSLFATTRCLSFFGVTNVGLRERRNAVVYLGELCFSIVALPILCWNTAVIFQEEEESFDAVNPNPYALARGLILTQALLYLLELFYRVQVRWSLVLHHVVTSFTFLYLNIVFAHTYSILALKAGLVMTILALTEQPLYVILLLRIVGYRQRIARKSWGLLCKLACACFVLTRLVVVTLVLVLIFQQSGSSDLSWSIRDVSFSDWHVSSHPFVEDPVVVNAVIVVLVVGILVSNCFAVNAMLHMSGSGKAPGPDESSEKESFATEAEVVVEQTTVTPTVRVLVAAECP